MKNTIFMHFGELFCPHYCISCGEIGGILCKRCKKYILSKHKNKCLVCGGDLENGRCGMCALPFGKQFWVGKREGALKELIKIYKYQSVRACS